MSKRIDEVLKEKGIMTTWFVKEVMQIPYGSWALRLKKGTITMKEVERAANYLGMTIDELKDAFVPRPKPRPAKRSILKTDWGRAFKVTANQTNRTFTIYTDGTKYRTVKLSKEEFDSCLNNTGNDWAEFLKGSDYYKV